MTLPLLDGPLLGVDVDEEAVRLLVDLGVEGLDEGFAALAIVRK